MRQHPALHMQAWRQAQHVWQQPAVSTRAEAASSTRAAAASGVNTSGGTQLCQYALAWYMRCRMCEATTALAVASSTPSSARMSSAERVEFAE